MKFKLFLVTISVLIRFTSFSQTAKEEVNIKADHWVNSKANDQSVYEKVELVKTLNNFKVVLGKKVLNYTIISRSKFSDLRDDYKVKLTNPVGTTNSIDAIISVAYMPDSTLWIGIEDDWYLSGIKLTAVHKY